MAQNAGFLHGTLFACRRTFSEPFQLLPETRNQSVGGSAVSVLIWPAAADEVSTDLPTEYEHCPVSDQISLIRQYFTNSPYRALQFIECSYERHQIKLEGRVGSFFLKQMAQETVRRQLGVLRIVNQIEVDQRYSP